VNAKIVKISRGLEEIRLETSEGCKKVDYIKYSLARYLAFMRTPKEAAPVT